MKRLIIPILLAVQVPLLFAEGTDSLQAIRAFEQVTGRLASSGFVLDDQFRFIRDAGFSHVISLLPGDQSHEDSIVRSLGMSFTNIGVDWGRPTMKNLADYLDDMERHGDEKVYLHCEANMRASAFLFLYRVIRQGTGKMEAGKAMFAIWYPVNQWHRFIEKGLEKYGLDPEYRYEPEFIRLFREYGPDAARAEVERIRQELTGSETLPFSEVDLERVGDEYAADRETGKALDAYRLNAEIFPESWKAREKLGSILLEEGDESGAREAWEKVAALNPENLWAKRMLGRLGEKGYEIYWQGTGIDPAVAGDLAGTYDMGSSQLVFSAGDGKFTLQPSWSRKPLELFADSPLKYFVHENNWSFEFPAGEPGKVLFTTSGGNTYTGVRIRK